MRQTKYDVIVVGAGHAGCEAARACARMGLRTAMVTMNLDLIAQMSCNPAVGGIAKGHLVREIDALGGVMGEVTDAVGIQFRLLNTSRGPAVWSPRAQCDKKMYRVRMREVLEREPNLRILQAEVAELAISDGPDRHVQGVRLRDGREITARAVVVTTGTFLNGLAHVGEMTYACGRNGEAPSELLGSQLRRLGLGWKRLKTGTPPRLDGRSIDWSRFEEQRGDAEPTPFSFMTDAIRQPQVNCYIAYTSDRSHKILKDNISRSPLYSGLIEGLGPRYCPSIEDKIVKFPDKSRHQIFLEPEGLDTYEVYVNGMSTSMPIDVQAELVASIPGLEDAEMIRPGYAIEYDAVDSRELKHSLEVRGIGGLFLAGQINGTSGYEEAACQGLIAGINAGRLCQGREAVRVERTEGYAGILVDDLVTKGADEPYRMFTSRAEFRLHLRIDNADARLTPLGRSVGTVCDRRWERFRAKQVHREKIVRYLERHRAQPGVHTGVSTDSRPSLMEWLRRPEASSRVFGDELRQELGEEPAAGVMASVEIECKYGGYLAQQLRQIEKQGEIEGRGIPQAIDFGAIPGLSREVKEKLTRMQPETLGQAKRIPGVTPAAIAALDVYLRVGGRARASVGLMPEECGLLDLLRGTISPYLSVSDAQLGDLVVHNKLVARWNGVVSLTRIVDLREAATRHYGEAAILAGVLGSGSISVVDIGSGAGFPGIPLAVLLPCASVTLVESDQRKGAFLKEACRNLSNCTVAICRSDALPGRFDWVVSRAVKWPDVERAAWRLSKSVAILAGDVFPESKLVQWREQRPIPWGQHRAVLIGQVVPRGT